MGKAYLLTEVTLKTLERATAFKVKEEELHCIASISASASSHGISDENSRQSEQTKDKGLKDCEKFLAKASRRVLMVTNIMIRDASCRQGLRLCCGELEQIEVQWRCKEIRRLVKQQLGELRGKEMQEMLLKAKNLPALCCMGIGRCDSRPFWF
ncbi:2S albumin-like [Durio zibethinus]|uniref:2S albumin-like n=1 Tax=Durio zibethinus TaxID=66656 RepID=A0A6P5XBJ2_DURZI|nr:2S albumin-like [Durio zibethinus]